MTSVQELAARVKSLITTLTPIYANLPDAYDAFKNGSVGAEQTKLEREIRDMGAQAATYNQDFVEEEAKIQALGGKSRRQTLQEFVLLFFFVAFGIFTASLALTSYARGEQLQAMKIIGVMIVIGILSCGVILQMA